MQILSLVPIIYLRLEILLKRHCCVGVSEALQEKGDFYSAETMIQKSLDIREKVLGKKHTSTLCSLSSLGAGLWKQGKNETAEEIYRHALKGFEEGKEYLDTLRTLNDLGLVLCDQEKYEETEFVVPLQGQ